MKEIVILYNNILGTYNLSNLRNHADDASFRSTTDIIEYFNKKPEGVKLRDRANLSIKVDLETVTDKNGRLEDLEKALDNIPWKKHVVEYIELHKYHPQTRKTHS